MTDIVDAETRSRMMAGIKSKNTKPELSLRSALHGQGFRYRLHGASLPGKPDLVFRKHSAACFVHGCFWHRHSGCKFATTPATRSDFWEEKFRRNVERDKENVAALLKQGWRVAIVWECSLGKRKQGDTVKSLTQWLQSEDTLFASDT